MQATSLGALEQYLCEVKKILPLSDGEEVQLLCKLSHGDIQARTRLIEAYRPLVVVLARRFERSVHDMELLDLIQEGNIGLIKAIDKYDEKKDGGIFKAWVISWIRGALLYVTWQRYGAFHLPVNKAWAIRQMCLIRDRLTSLLGREPQVEEIAQEMELPPQEVKDLQILHAQRIVSLNQVLDEEEGITLQDVIGDPATIAQKQNTSLEAQLQSLPERERLVVQLRYGFADGQSRTCKEVADLLAISWKTVERLDRQALMRLRKMLATSNDEFIA